MLDTYLYIMNDKWFDFETFLKDCNYEFWYDRRPKRITIGSRIYLYLSGGTKAIKYEFEVIKVSDDQYFKHMNEYDWKKYLKNNHTIKEGEWEYYNNRPACKLKLIREIKNIEQTSITNMREKGKILGMLMSNRELKPYAIEWLQKIK